MINVDWCDLVQKFFLPFCLDWSFCHKLQSYTSRGSFQQSIIKLLLKSNDWVRLSEHKGWKSCGFRQSTTIFPNSDFWNWTSSIGKAFLWIFFRFTLRQETEVQVSSEFHLILAPKSNRAAARCPHAPSAL